MEIWRGSALLREPRIFPTGVIEHLYIHIPFCPKVCPYCGFYKEPMTSSAREPFVDALITELRGQNARLDLRPRTIFFGGGTPTALSVGQLDRLFTAMHRELDLHELREWTMEMNPATVSAEKAALLRDAGVTRVSMGVQSWDPEILHVLGRVHDVRQAEESYAILRDAGIPQVNLDFIFAVPGQTLEQWEQTLRKTVGMQPDHVSAYNLTYEEDTEFFRRFQRGEFRQEPDDDAEFFELTRALLGEAGFEAYEISNFAPPGQECRHNLAYWFGHDYLGLGPSAFSTLGIARRRNIANTTEYTRRLREDADGLESVVDFREEVDEATRRFEKIAFGLRTKFGIDPGWVRDQPEVVAELRRTGLLMTRPHERANLVLTPKGRLLADSVAEMFLQAD
jgi:oxygen-independent coproporphyrinogen-3 oxidase